jgi:hypothetical protein
LISLHVFKTALGTTVGFLVLNIYHLLLEHYFLSSVR